MTNFEPINRASIRREIMEFKPIPPLIYERRNDRFMNEKNSKIIILQNNDFYLTF